MVRVGQSRARVRADTNEYTSAHALRPCTALPAGVVVLSDPPRK